MSPNSNTLMNGAFCRHDHTGTGTDTGANTGADTGTIIYSYCYDCSMKIIMINDND